MGVNNLAVLLRAREEELAAIYQNIPGILFYIAVEADGKFRFLSVSRDFLVTTGLTREQIVGSLVGDVIPQPSRDIVLNHYREAILSGQTVRWEEESFYPAGRRYGEVAVTPLCDATGTATHLVGIVHDITERKQDEGRVRERGERLQLALDASGGGSWAWDARTNSLDWDDRFRAQFGFSPAEQPAFDAWLARVKEEDRPQLLGLLDEIMQMKTMEGWNNTYRILRPDGKLMWIQSLGRANRDAEGHLLRLTGLELDVTERKLAEEALRFADLRKNEFLATLGHELRNPLAALSMGLQLARRKSRAESTLTPDLEMMDRQLTQLARLVDDLLDVGRVSTGKIELRLRSLTLPHVLANAVEEARAAIESRHHEVQIQIRPGHHLIRGDSARLTQVIANLIENAAKYTEPGGQIRLSLAHEDGTEVVRVEDDGIGIPAGELPRVFDLFSQVRIHQGGRVEGLGIGLAIVRKLVELHGGTVDASSAGLSRGSTFTVRLPALEETTSTPAPDVLCQDRSKGRRPPCRVLVVDDNEDAAASLAEFLGLEGHQTWIAHDGFQAIEIAKATELDLVLMDLGLPGLDGIEAAKRIKALAGCDRLRIAALTGWGQESDLSRTREAGFSWHLVKPVNTTFLSELIAKLEPLRDGKSLS
jgi:PAS domain S-box-containing protein